MRLEEILVYYDGPQVVLFMEEDQRYIGTLYDRDEEKDQFLAVAVSESDVEDLRLGKQDLRSIYDQTSIKITISHNITSEPLKDIETWMLPEKDFYLNEV